MSQIFGGIEAGGTKIICTVGTSPSNIHASARFPTTSPKEAVHEITRFFLPFISQGELAAVGIGSFGPLDLNPNSSTYGSITNTPKPGWQGFSFANQVQKALGIPITIDTDVNAAAFGEYAWGPSGRSMDPLVYVTVGTGIGVGVIINGQPLHGMIHPEAGHLFIPHDQVKDPFKGICPFHGDCLEGLASGPAIKVRWNQSPETLPADHPAWDLETDYLSIALANLIYSFSPRRIVLGGGVALHVGLHEAIRMKVRSMINGYIPLSDCGVSTDNFIIPPFLGDQSGVLGAMAMASALLSR
jgi:fructokinase